MSLKETKTPNFANYKARLPINAHLVPPSDKRFDPDATLERARELTTWKKLIVADLSGSGALVQQKAKISSSTTFRGSRSTMGKF